MRSRRCSPGTQAWTSSPSWEQPPPAGGSPPCAARCSSQPTSNSAVSPRRSCLKTPTSARRPPPLASCASAIRGRLVSPCPRVLAPRSRYQEVVDGLIAQASAMVIGDPMAPETTMGPLVSPRHRASVESYVASGIADGARVAAGGRRPAAPVRGYYYEPTVFAEATSTMTIARDEIFGPVVTVIPYRDEPEAVAVANDSEYGLAGSVWTSDPDHGLEIARKLHVGTFGVNLYIPDLGSPWGGFKSSGQGTAYGPEGLSAYLKPKSVFFPAPRQAEF